MQEQRFTWSRQWYPLTAVDNLDPGRPTPITVLGTNLVVWWEAAGSTWRCFRDVCPHRAAPLSEGKVNAATGNLQCAYHGWQFGGSGAAQDIPQSEPGAAKATACSSPRSCATSYPTTLSHGLLWVRLEPGGAAAAEAAGQDPLPELPTTDERGVAWFPVSPWYVRDLEVDYVPLMENSCDPGHVHFTHAGFIGSPDNSGPITVRQLDVQGKVEPGVYRFVTDDPKHATYRNQVLKPPCMVWTSSKGLEGGNLALLYFVVPVAPGKSRMLSMPMTTNPRFRLLSKIFHWQPFIDHLINHTIAAQDVSLQHRQGTNITAADFPGWLRGYHLPTASDSGVVALRKWLEEVAGGGVAWGPNVPAAAMGAPLQPELRREHLMNTYHQHTEHCPYCLRALRGIRAARTALLGVGGPCLLGLAYTWDRGTEPLAPPSLALAACLGATFALRTGLQSLAQQFVVSDWRHADH